MTHVINGRLLSENILTCIKQELEKQFQITRLVPKVATVLIGNNAASKLYVHSKLKAAAKVGINTELLVFKEEIDNQKLHEIIISLNNRLDITGILVQLPLPSHLDEHIVFQSICHTKDVDAFGIHHTGLLNHWRSKIMPCTPQGIIFVLKKYLQHNLSGKKVIIIGRSVIVGRPMASILIKESCTVTITHSKTVNLKEECRQSDIVIAAAGKPHLVKKDWIKNGAFVIDVGINRINNELVGDVDFLNVKNKASFITPVPGGIGPLTVANLLLNTLNLFLIQNNLSCDDEMFKNIY